MVPQHNSQSHRAREVTPEKDCIAAIVFSAPNSWRSSAATTWPPRPPRGGAGFVGGFACRERLLSFDDPQDLTHKVDAFYHHPPEQHEQPPRNRHRPRNKRYHSLETAISSSTSASSATTAVSPDFERREVRTPWKPKRSERNRNHHENRNTRRHRDPCSNHHHNPQRPPLQVIPVSCVPSSSSIVPSINEAPSSSSSFPAGGARRRRRQRETTHSYRGDGDDGKQPGYHRKGRRKQGGCLQSLLGTVFRKSPTSKEKVRKPPRQQQPQQQHRQYHPSKGHHHKNRYFTPPQLTENYHPHPATSSIVTSRTLV